MSGPCLLTCLVLRAGGLFNPLGFGRSPNSMQELKTKEIKNGRSAVPCSPLT